MSTFTQRTSSNEIARNLFSGLKSHAFRRLRDFANTDKDWEVILNAVANWDKQALSDELAKFTEKYQGVESDFRFTVLRTVKTLQLSSGASSTMRIKPRDLERIDLTTFFATFMKQLAECPDICDSKERFLKLSPTDRNVIAEDIFRPLVYGVARNIQNCLVDSESQQASRQSRQSSRAPTVDVQEEELLHADVRADDSVSVAPSEAISEQQRETSDALNAQLLSLHNRSLKNSKHSKRSRRASSPSKLPKQFVHIAQPGDQAGSKAPIDTAAAAAADVAEEIELDVPSTKASNRKSKFSRAPPPSKKSLREDDKPYFFHSETTRTPQSMSTRITRF